MEFLSIEKHFKNLCDSNPHLKLLESQWRIDKELIAKALQNVNAVFPHYSRHDASHSKQIIVNIERLLGNRIRHLTATDAWLILEAAYNHDIGMVVTYRQLDDLNSDDFKDFIKDISCDSDNPLSLFAKHWLTQAAVLPTGSASREFLNQYTQLLAEWFRRKHPQNSAHIVKNPLHEIGLDSPRNELLPKRLFGMLAEICRLHGEDFDKVLNLPFAEAGMGVEDCHPRYVACLLRMGDLLDIDSDRFCPVMINVYGKALPKTSCAHLEKHYSIKAFRLDSERIEIVSECPNPDSYQAAYEWFSWLELEHHQQNQHWALICPSKKLGTLPILTKPRVDISLPYFVLERGKKPDLNIDKNALLTLVRGTGLYSTKFDSIREILQNAVDASLMAAWETDSSLISDSSPVDHSLTNLLSDYQIDIQLTKKDVNDTDVLTLTVIDKGIGIDTDSLKHMLNVGSSAKNRFKSRTTEQMPVWYRPSGNFGIGLQSCYLITDEFKVITKSRRTGEAMSIHFFKESSKAVILKKEDPKDIPYGTKFTMDVHVTSFPQQMSMLSGDLKDEFQQRLAEYDFTDDSATMGFYERLKIMEQISKFSVHTPIPVKLNGVNYSKTIDNIHYDPEQQALISNVYFGIDAHRTNTFFRGQSFETKIHINLVSLDYDTYRVSASEILTYNRDSILNDVQDQLKIEIVQAVLRYIDTHYDKLVGEERSVAAAFWMMNSDTTEFGSYHQDVEMLNIPLVDNPDLTLKSVVECLISGEIPFIIEHRPQTTGSDKRHMLRRGNSAYIPLISYMMRKRGYFLRESIDGDAPSYTKYTWSCDDGPFISPQLFNRKIERRYYSSSVGSRIMFPCWGRYKDLALNERPMWSAVMYSEDLDAEYFVLPLVHNSQAGTMDFDISDKLIDWAYRNRKYEKISPLAFKTLYEGVEAELKTYLKSIDTISEDS